MPMESKSCEVICPRIESFELRSRIDCVELKVPRSKLPLDLQIKDINFL